MNRESVIVNLDRPGPRQHRWMHRIGVLGILLSVPALLVLLGLMGLVAFDGVPLDEAAAGIKWACRIVITGFLLSAVGFWNR